ncbi:sensor histidine kinase [Faecalicatena contorta]|uniref:sensor histidine kinase n=1 Tax=Faecalicatena contorta TaxID=39482 RepID=UPI001F35D8A6|nr:sensor histidine kinase [Faecalicatena contorta]MCF2683161.1 sensor histidine kinase [Faecalicatena contorta]
MKILKEYLKERVKEIFLYIGIVGIYTGVCYLYEVRTDALWYSMNLSVACILLYEIAGYFSYKKHHDKLLVMEKNAGAIQDIMPEAWGMVERDYQRILKNLEEAKKELESADRISRQEMADYYGMWVHQIKTPIAAMQVLLQSCEETLEGDVSYTREMKLELFKIEQYVEMVLTYLRMEQMSSDLALECYALDDIIRHAVRKYSRMFILRKIRLEYGAVNEQVLTDEKWLGFVLEQILSNALKYTRSGGTVFVYMKKDPDKKKRYLVVEDTGIGIQAEDLPRIFEKGFTGYNGRTDKKSTGIGLYLCKQIMDKLGHRIWAESDVDQGTRICLMLEREEFRHE